MRTIPAGRSAEKGTMYTGQRGLAVRHPMHPVCGLRTAVAPVALLDARRPVDLHQAAIYRPVKVPAPAHTLDAVRLRHRDRPIPLTALRRTTPVRPARTKSDYQDHCHSPVRRAAPADRSGSPSRSLPGVPPREVSRDARPIAQDRPDQASGSPRSGAALEIRISSPSICMVTLSPSTNGNAESPATSAGMLTNRVRAGPCARILPSPFLPIQSILQGNVFILIRCSM